MQTSAVGCLCDQRIALVDLPKAYLQLHIDQSLWPYQTVVSGAPYCLTQLGFGLNIMPLVMKKILSTKLSWDKRISHAISSNLDDILVDEKVALVEEVEKHLRGYSLDCKPAERVHNGARVLGMSLG